jgi:hypothetical protein
MAIEPHALVTDLRQDGTSMPGSAPIGMQFVGWGPRLTTTVAAAPATGVVAGLGPAVNPAGATQH